MLARGGFDALVVAKLVDVLRATSSSAFPNIRRCAQEQLAEIERNLANPGKSK